MGKLTDEELLELALTDIEEQDNNNFDIPYYQERFVLQDGTYKVYTNHIYMHYKNWSYSPVSKRVFHELMNLKTKHRDAFFIDRNKCTLDLNKILGDYVKRTKKEIKEKKRSVQVSRIESKT